MEARKILVVEDDGIVARDIQHSLEQFGYEVPAIASSGESALEKAAQIGPDLILMDIVLKGEMDGIEAADRIRAQYDIPVIFLTAYADDATLERAKVTEPFGYLLKPFEESVLHSTIEMALYRHKLEAALRESEKRFRDLYENAPNAYFSVGVDGLIRECNTRAGELLGYTVAELVGRPILELYADTPQGKEKALRVFELFEAGGPVTDEELQLRRSDGSLVWVSLTVNAIRDTRGHILESRTMAVDISERKEMESALRESVAQFRSIFDNAAVGIALVDINERFIDCNDTWCRMLGYRRDELLNLTPREVTPEGEIVLGYDSINKNDTEQKYHRLEKRYVRKDGSEFWADLSVTVLYDPEGKPDRMLRIIMDITERKQTEEALKESEAKFRSLAEQSPNMIFINKEGRIAYANNRCEEVMGYSRDEYYSPDFDFLTLIAPESLDSVKESFKKQLMGEQAAPYEYVLITKDGRRIKAIVTTRLISYEGESAILGIVTDITERVQVEEALQQHNRNLALLNQVSQTLIATLDLPHIFERLLRAAVEVANAEDSSVWLWDENRPGELVCRAILHRGEFSTPRELRLGPGQGVAGWVAQKGRSATVAGAQEDPRFFGGVDQQIKFHTTSLLAVPLKMRDHVHGVLEVVNKKGHDPAGRSRHFAADDRVLVEMLAASAAIAIDNARLIEALRRYGMELETRNQDLDAFAHTVAHDLKNPLSYMVGYAEVLEEDAKTMPAEAVRRYLRTIAQNGRRMTNIIDELLLLAGVRKIEQMDMASLDMESIVADAQERLADLIEENQAEIILPDVWPTARGHGPWVEEIWVNYISNAIKYGGQPPRVELGATEQKDATVRFWVADNGPGLTPEEQSRLFRSFERLDRVRAKGHGLGLSITRRIVEKLGGRVGVNSQVGHGSVFSFTLPSAER